MHALAGPKKTDILAQLEGPCSTAGVKLVLHPKPKKEDGAAQIAALLDACKASADSPVVGALPKVRGEGLQSWAWRGGRSGRCMQADLAQ